MQSAGLRIILSETELTSDLERKTLRAYVKIPKGDKSVKKPVSLGVGKTDGRFVKMDLSKGCKQLEYSLSYGVIISREAYKHLLRGQKYLFSMTGPRKEVGIERNGIL